MIASVELADYYQDSLRAFNGNPVYYLFAVKLRIGLEKRRHHTSGKSETLEYLFHGPKRFVIEIYRSRHPPNISPSTLRHTSTFERLCGLDFQAARHCGDI